ncbi:MAG: hypothetical protein E6I62_00670 [Chloroflexi bacterium]|jgi:hypothetical protein|nr:MAG: hypothetical protein E6I62_00670 [Chloroflexota bacterium]
MIPREAFILPFELQHRHTDGTDHGMQPKHHDPSEHDPERTWLVRQEFQCMDCDETVTLIPGEKS